MLKATQRIVASVLLFCNISQFAFAAALPGADNTQGQQPKTLNSAAGAPKSILPSFANGPYSKYPS